MGRLFAGCMQATSKDVLLEDCKRPEPVLTDKHVELGLAIERLVKGISV